MCCFPTRGLRCQDTFCGGSALEVTSEVQERIGHWQRQGTVPVRSTGSIPRDDGYVTLIERRGAAVVATRVEMVATERPVAAAQTENLLSSL